MEKEPKIKLKRNEDIVGAKIPDDDLSNWIETLKDGGFTQEEIDIIVSGLNKAYAKRRRSELIDEEMRKTEEELFKKSGKLLASEDADWLKKRIERRFEGEE
jgi:hypothetical protein